MGGEKNPRPSALEVERRAANYSATVSTVMVPPQEHLSDDAETRTIWALTYMMNLRVLGLDL
jgi:hypothetical protein